MYRCQCAHVLCFMTIILCACVYFSIPGDLIRTPDLPKNLHIYFCDSRGPHFVKLPKFEIGKAWYTHLVLHDTVGLKMFLYPSP